MLTFAGRPKSSVFGRHSTDTSPPMDGEGGGGGKSSRIKRLSFMMHSPRPSQSPGSDVSPMASVPPKEVQPETKLDAKMPARTDSVKTKASTTIDTSVSYFPPPIKVDAKIDETQASSGEPSPMDPRKSSISFPEELPKPDHSPSDRTPTDARSESSFGRKSSISSVSFRRSRNPSIAPGPQKQTPYSLRIRNASPPPQR
ncbi:hypothetical protein VFPPC_14138 [Pochonia chlamydosporia 170]|uniref:Uncharacterized protein n=1 Tax=Pochonia chlamydosporia 170 TaxID=1380566 RepID=A0A179FBE1_METCM|nr:hypothetical protein VFPPC_14138 [Pochonia chlamydosporia 170]OAQ62393.1 hypothetical protein VFPPC_14138 [Pochonia chlamydosporia 170]